MADTETKRTVYPPVRPLGRAPRPLGWLFSKERTEGLTPDHDCATCPDCTQGARCRIAACCQEDQ